MPVFDLIAWGLLTVWAGLLFGGFLLGKDPTRQRRMPAWTRMASSATLVLLSWYGYFLTRPGTGSAGFAVGIAGGMTAGFVGDLFLARLLPAPNRVLAGIVAFGVGHLLYILAIVQFHARLPPGSFGPAQWLALLLWLAVGSLAGWAVLLWRQRQDALRLAGLGYALLLAATAGFASGLALAQPLFAVLAVGAALFLLSDLILAGELFSGWRFPYIGDAVWLLYGPGQALIVASIWAALQTPA